MTAETERSASTGEEGIIDWVVLTRGDRPSALEAALASLRSSPVTGAIIVVANGLGEGAMIESAVSGVTVVESDVNLGIPAGRDLGLRSTTTKLVGFLDDDARLESTGLLHLVVGHFAQEPSLAAMTLRLVDEDGATSRRHNPRRGTSDVHRSGPVTTFLGGASILRRSAYLQAGGYWDALVYGHEELDLAWRMIGDGGSIRYEPEICVFHPRTEIGRHRDGWWRTGRNRVLVARRNLPRSIGVVHTLSWLALGTFRAPGWHCRRGYVVGWFGGWRVAVERAPLSWSALRELRRLGRFPII